MSTNKPKCPVHEEEPKRTKAKLTRGFGIGAMKKMGIDMEDPKVVATWGQKSDPLFKVKGIERTIRMKEFR